MDKAIEAAARIIDPLAFEERGSCPPRGYECHTPEQLSKVIAARKRRAISVAKRMVAAYLAAQYQRLDEAGIPTHPEGEHSAAGCRIGDRLDIALAEKAARERAEQELANFGDRISAAIGTNDYLDPPDGGGPELAEQVRRMRTEVVRLKEIAVLSRRFMRANWCTAEYYQLQRELLDKLRAALGGLNG